MKIITLLFLFTFFSCQSKEEEAVTESNSANELPVVENDTLTAVPDTSMMKTIKAGKDKSLLEVKSIYSDTLGYGYEIYNEGKLYIRQPIIPAIPGNHGFKTKADALRTGNYVKEKIDKGIMPPSMTIEELKKLKVY